MEGRGPSSPNRTKVCNRRVHLQFVEGLEGPSPSNLPAIRSALEVKIPSLHGPTIRSLVFLLSDPPARKMKISNVIVHNLVAPVERPYRNCCSDWIRSRATTVFEVRTDNGLAGWGEGDGVPSPDEIETCVVGRSPFDYEVIYDRLTDNGRNARSASGIEIALWDLMGKAQEVPVYQLLGGARRTQVPVYASGFFKRADADHVADVAEEAGRFRDASFQAIKLRIGFGPDQDEQIVAAVREAIGAEVKLAVDANTGYDVSTAIEVGRRLDPYDLLWFEEPIDGKDVDGYCEIKQALPIRIAGGESLIGLQSFMEIVQRGAVDLLQPDIGRAGGFTEGRRICDLAAVNEVQVIPHMFGGVVRLAATLQWLATLPFDPTALDPFPTYLELDVMENGLRTDLAVTPFEPKDGVMAIPDRPGLGVEIDEEMLRKFAV